MHLLVLSAFRPDRLPRRRIQFEKSQCTFWCSVLSDWTRLPWRSSARVGSQCTFWCSVLSDTRRRRISSSGTRSQCTFWCSVLSDGIVEKVEAACDLGLNAPFGAQCFPTGQGYLGGHRRGSGLNAPFGAQCFPTWSHPQGDPTVDGSQCTFWCSVLSDRAT